MVSVTSASNYIVLVGCSDGVDYRGLKIRESNGICLFYFSTKTYVVGSQKNHLIEMVLLSTQNTFFKSIGKKMITTVRLKKSLSGPILMSRLVCILVFYILQKRVLTHHLTMYLYFCHYHLIYCYYRY